MHWLISHSQMVTSITIVLAVLSFWGMRLLKEGKARMTGGIIDLLFLFLPTLFYMAFNTIKNQLPDGQTDVNAWMNFFPYVVAVAAAVNLYYSIKINRTGIGVITSFAFKLFIMLIPFLGPITIGFLIKSFS